jgi:hypothetical protein
MYYYYIINNELVDNIKAMEWMKNNIDTEVICLDRGIDKKFKYINGYFTSYIYGVGWERITTYYTRLPESSYEEDIKRFFDEKQWCPIQ